MMNVRAQMALNQENTATIESESMAPQMTACVIDIDFSEGGVDSTPGAMPKLGTSEFEEQSRSLDTRSMGYRFVKRAFDIFMSVCVLAILLVLFPATLVVLVATAISTKGSPIYVQERVGQYGKRLPILKLRTMVHDSDNVEKYLNPEQLEQWRKERKVTSDPRITKFGALCRKTSIDEVPQFINVLLGQMSVIGPRCITEEELHWYSDKVTLLLSVPQGITGAWQIGERNNAFFENGERQKIELTYINSSSISFDIQLCIDTFIAMFLKRSGK